MSFTIHVNGAYYQFIGNYDVKFKNVNGVNNIIIWENDEIVQEFATTETVMITHHAK